MISDDRFYQLRLARDARDLRAAQRLRYRVFIEELGGTGAGVDNDARLERDSFDAVCDHLLLIDSRRDPGDLEDVVGAYRLLPGNRLAADAAFYSEAEFDLTPLRASGRRLLELGRSCLHPDHRGGTALLRLWNGLADYVQTHGIEVLFGVASFHGTDLTALAQPLSYLARHHRAADELRVSARGAQRATMALLPDAQIDRRSAMLATPALIKAYLRLGGVVGDGAWVDHAFNTTDICMVLDTARLTAKHRTLYGGHKG